MENSILHVIVLYNQSYYKCNTYKTLLSQKKDITIYIWDNSKDCCCELFNESNIIYNHEGINRGVSYAYNQAYNYAKSNNYKWLLFLDQDTIFNSNFFDELNTSINKNPDIDVFFPTHIIKNKNYLSPVRFKYGIPKISKEKLSGKIELEDHAIINSGLMIKVDTFEKAGGYNEKVFLDFSDIQFIERLSKITKYGMILNTTCIQDFSNCIDKKEKVLDRFKLYCLSVKWYESSSLKKKLILNYIVIKRCFSVVIKTKSIKPFFIYLNYFVKK